MFNSIKEYFISKYNKLFKKSKEPLPQIEIPDESVVNENDSSSPVEEEILVENVAPVIPSDSMRKIAKAKVALTLKYPWWASLVLRLEIVHDEVRSQGTMSTNGRYIFYCDAFVNSLTIEELIGVIAHEGLHCGFLHMTRKGERERGKWNAACDFPINSILIESGQTLPKGGLYDKQYSGMTAEEVYPLLSDKYCDPIWGFVIPDDFDNMTEKEQTQWRDALAHAMSELRKKGLLSDSWDRMIQKAMAPRVPWRELLSSFLQTSIGQEDYTWKRPSRRSHLTGISLPGRFEFTCLPIGIAIDTSGSIGDEDLYTAIAAVRSVAEDMRIEKIIIVEADMSVHGVTELLNGDIWEPKSLKGGGGTSFVPAIEKLEEENCAAIVYITDLQGEFPYAAPLTPVIWVTKSNSSVPFGQVVRIS